MGGLPSSELGLDGPVGKGLSLAGECPAEFGLSSVSALGPVGGGFPVRDWISVTDA